MLQIYHNPRCRKSRETLSIIQNSNQQVEIIEYLKNPPSKAELKELIRKMDVEVEDILRKNEKLYKENYKGKEIPTEKWIEILTENPILIERPIVIKGAKAILGRPPEKVRELLD